MEGLYIFNIYSLALIFSSIPAFALAVWIGLHKNKSLFNWYSLLLFAAALWAVAYGFELASQSLEQMLFWIKIEYIGICALPTLWLVFCFNFIGREYWVNPYSLGIFILYSVSTYIAIFTNNSHHLFYASTQLNTIAAPFPLLEIEPGPWYRLHTLIFYAMVIWGYISLFFYLGSSKSIFRKQNIIIIISTLIPLLVNVAYVFLEIRPYGHLDLTPFAFLLTAFIIAMGLLRIGLFDLMPVARAKVINQMGDGFVLIDDQGRISDFNESFLKLSLKREEDLLANSLDEIFGENISSQKSRLANVIKYNDHHYELSRVDINQGSKVIGQSILFKNVTERVIGDRRLKEQRLELQKLNRLKDRLFSIIAHDLRGPLHNLQEVLSLVNANLLSEDERESLMQDLSSSVDQSVGLMENLLSWASSQQKGESIKRESFNLNDLLLEVLHSINALLEKKSLEVTLDIDQSALVLADKEMIKIVLRNLISNAVKFSNESTTISISASPGKKGLEIAVSDQGIGMSAEEMKKLFSLDLRSKRGTSNEEGSGLGLMLCKDFIEKNSGSLKVKSEEGKGSTFSFCLPQTDVSAET
tara:strand:- start:2904 stop:4658 length:1755 start_codon:yes stop_codon:yes gene_type:complete